MGEVGKGRMEEGIGTKKAWREDEE